ncbi:MAG: NAD(P)H-hydrate dehydratase [Pseudomonadota bacterium]
MTELLTTQEMYEADRRTIASGVAGDILMEHAGAVVMQAIDQNWTTCPVAVLCGPGNNGGDGFVIARLLREKGWQVRLGLLGSIADLQGDAALNAERWGGPVELPSPALLVGAELVVDCLFGAGLARDIDGDAATLIEAVNNAGLPVVAVDIPSGVDGNTGEVRGIAIDADLTVTFCRAKPGHYLLPGRERCGRLVVADIGITDDVIAAIGPQVMLNHPDVWRDAICWPAMAGHKYHRGHVLALGGAQTTGAIRLSTRGARRVGAGLLTVIADPAVLALYAADAPGVMTAPTSQYEDMLQDCRHNAIIIGPGCGIGDDTRWKVIHALRSCCACVLDADALTSFAEDSSALFFAIQGQTVLTPHEGEFSRLFPDITGNKINRARAAAKRSGATIVLKGADTVIAAPDGRARINAADAPWLATAGSGDVLAGMIAGLLAQGMAMFDAASMAVWLHGEAGQKFGPGLIAEDIPEMVPGLLSGLWRSGG